MMFGLHDPNGHGPCIGSNTASDVKKYRTERMNSRSMDYKTCSGTPSALGAGRLPGPLLILLHVLSHSAQRSLIVWPPLASRRRPAQRNARRIAATGLNA